MKEPPVESVAPLAGRAVVPMLCQLAQGAQKLAPDLERPKATKLPAPSVGVDTNGQRGWFGLQRIPAGIPHAE